MLLLALAILLSAAVADAAPTSSPTPRASPTGVRTPAPRPIAPAIPSTGVGPTATPTATPTPLAPPTAMPAPTPMPAPTLAPAESPRLPVIPPTLPSPRPTSTPAAPELLDTELVGYSRQGRPILAYRLGAGQRTGLVIGGIHAGTESNTADLVQQLLERARDRPDLLPPDLAVEWLPIANPDGLMDGTRLLSTGVDPNRNWPTLDWSADTYESTPRGPELLLGGGGEVPLSEPETLALAALCLRLRPGAVISYHSAAGLVTGGPAARALGLDVVYAQTAGYRLGDWTAYPVTGDFAQWAEDQAIPTVEVELPDHFSTDLEANWIALLSLLWTAFP